MSETKPVRYPNGLRHRPDADCRCVCAYCLKHAPCAGRDGADDEPLCCCHGAPWLRTDAGPCS